MGILLYVTEERNRQGSLNIPAPKLYGIPYITKMRANGNKTNIFISSGSDVQEERVVSESYSDLNLLANIGYVDFLIPLTVIGISGNVNDNYPYIASLKASDIVEVSQSASNQNNSIVRYRNPSRKEDIFYTVQEDLATIQSITPASPGGWFSLRRELTQAEVRTLNTANGNYGIKLIDAPGANKFIDYRNPRIIYKAIGGAFVDADIWIYDDVKNASVFQGVTNSLTIIPSTQVEYLNLEEGAYGGINGNIFIYSSVQQSTFEGTWIVEFEYRIIDV